MYQDDDLAAMFSHDNFNTIMQSLGSDENEQINGLTTLSNTLLFATESRLGNWPLSDICQRLTHLLRITTNPVIRDLIPECMARAANAHEVSARQLVRAGALQLIGACLDAFHGPESASNCISVINAVAEQFPAEIATVMGISPLLKHIRILAVPDRRTAGHTILKITNGKVTPAFIDDIPVLLNVLQLPDASVRSDCATALSNILAHVNLDNVPPEIVVPFVQTLNQIDEPQTLQSLLAGLCRLADLARFAGICLTTDLDFNRIYFDLPLGQSTTDIRATVIRLIRSLLPDPDMPGLFLKRDRPPDARFAASVQPLIERAIVKRTGDIGPLLSLLAATARTVPIVGSRDLISCLLSLTQSGANLQAVIAVVSGFSDLGLAVKYGLVRQLQSAPPPSFIRDWFSARLAAIIARADMGEDELSALPEFGNLEEIARYVTAGDLLACQFQASGLLEQMVDFMLETDDVSPAAIPAIEFVTALVHEIVDGLPRLTVTEPFGDATIDQLVGRSTQANISTGGNRLSGMAVPFNLDLGALEVWFNNRQFSITKDNVIAKLQASEFADLVLIPDQETILYTLHAPFRRALGFENDVRYHVRVNDVDFSVYDGMFQAAARTKADPQKIRDAHAIELVPGDIPRAPVEVELGLSESAEMAFRLLQNVHRLLPQVSLVREEFVRDLCQQLQSPTLTIGFHSMASKILWHFPFLFDFDTRLWFFKVVGFDMRTGLSFLHHRFPRGSWTHPSHTILKARIRRDSLFEDGMKLMRIAGEGATRFEILFVGEEGVGLGPTQEFFTKFAQEFCRESRGIWRSDKANGEFAWSERGLFPAPNADPKLFYTIGLLCGKALLLDMILPLPINPAFFKLIVEEPVDVAEVDPALAKSLANPSGLVGLFWTYPGIDDLPLVENGGAVEVTEANLARFVSAIKKKTVELRDVVREFRNGFSAIVPWEFLRLFSHVEVARMICGEGVAISREDLRKFVEVSHGYSAQSPQIEMFYELVAGMSDRDQAMLVKFVTGCDKLPIGGLRNLTPKLTIAQRASLTGQSPDETLPSVMTCTNYLKIPVYSSIDVMREKVMKAISDGQDTFQLS
jgi:hypothetical protein